MKNRKWIFDAPYYTFIKKHYCPQCSSEMNIKKVSKTVNSKSEEAKNFDFSHIDSYLHGDVIFTWYIFHCDKCSIEMSLREMKIYERTKKRCAHDNDKSSV